MINHFGNFILDDGCVLGIGTEISGGYVFPTTIGTSGQALIVTVDPLGYTHLEFKDLGEYSPFNVISTDTILDDTYSWVVISGGVSLVTLPDPVANDGEVFKLSNLSGSSVTLSGSKIDTSAFITVVNNEKLEVKAALGQWWTF